MIKIMTLVRIPIGGKDTMLGMVVARRRRGQVVTVLTADGTLWKGLRCEVYVV